MRDDRSRRRRRWLRVGVAVVVIAIAFLLLTRTTIIEPPTAPGKPVSVFLVDHGTHASLLLPSTLSGVFVEWAFGEWDWYALDESAGYRVVPALMWPTRGALGRRERRLPADTQVIRERLRSEQVLELVVEVQNTVSLSTLLQTAFERRRGTQHYQRLYDLDFVHDDRDYHLLQTCNQVVALWLELLGCRVTGPAILSDWAVREP